MDQRVTAGVQRLYQACTSFHRHRPEELFRWLVADVLAGFGVKASSAPPEDVHEWLWQNGREYSALVQQAPFADALGSLYQLIASRGHRGGLGQFFSPPALADMMAAIAANDVVADARENQACEGNDRLLRMCEPACGSGAMVLAFLRHHVSTSGSTALERWSVTAIDLDPFCAEICATQVLANLFMHQCPLGELVVYAGNALGNPRQLLPLVHATSRDLRPDLVLPALHPSRIAALRDVAATRAEESASPDEASSAVASSRAREPKTFGREELRQVNLFDEQFVASNQST